LVIRTPVALETALAMAAIGGTQAISPAPSLTPGAYTDGSKPQSFLWG
jgi:hypothetical protein